MFVGMRGSWTATNMRKLAIEGNSSALAPPVRSTRFDNKWFTISHPEQTHCAETNKWITNGLQSGTDEQKHCADTEYEVDKITTELDNKSTNTIDETLRRKTKENNTHVAI